MKGNDIQPERLIRLCESGLPRIAIKNCTAIISGTPDGHLNNVDIVVEDGKIEAVGAGVAAGVTSQNAVVVDGTDYIVCPGFVDTHRHCWHSFFRQHGMVSGWQAYSTTMHQGLATVYDPEDMYVGSLLASLTALDSGVTTLVDWSHNSRTPDHSDAAIEGLIDAGIRGVYVFAAPRFNAKSSRHPQDADRLQEKYFASDDKLVSMMLGTYSLSTTIMMGDDIPEGGVPEPRPNLSEHFRFARERGLRISVEGCWFEPTSESLIELFQRGEMGPDTTYVHCRNLSDEAWQAIAASGGSVSIAPRLAFPGPKPLPATQDALDHGIRPSISLDTEFNGPNDFVRILELTMHLQRAEVGFRIAGGDENPPPRLSAREMLEFGTIEGARANGMERRTGSIAVGKDADLLLYDVSGINAFPVNHPANTIVLGSSRGNLAAVLVAGRPVKWGGQLVGVDLGQVRALAESAKDRLIERWSAQRGGLPDK